MKQNKNEMNKIEDIFERADEFSSSIREETIERIYNDTRTIIVLYNQSIGYAEEIHKLRTRTRKRALPMHAQEKIFRLEGKTAENILAMERAAERVNVESEVLHLKESPWDMEKDIVTFASHVVAQYSMSYDIFKENKARAIANGMPFKLSQHETVTKKLMKLAQKAHRAGISAYDNGAVPDLFEGVQKVDSLGTRKTRVRKHSCIRKGHARTEINGMIDVCKGGQYTTVRVPAIRDDVTGQCYISEVDYKKLLKKGTPAVRLDVTRTRPYSHKSAENVSCRKRGVVTEYYGYSMNANRIVRERAILRAFNSGITKDYLHQWMQMKFNFSKFDGCPYRKWHNNIASDLAFIDNLERDFYEKETVRDVDIVDRKAAGY